MPWSNQGGGPWGSSGGKGPWGSGQQPSGGSSPPDLEELLRRSQDLRAGEEDPADNSNDNQHRDEN